MVSPRNVAEEVTISPTAHIEEGADIAGIEGPLKRLVVGDYTFIDQGVRVRCRELVIGDHVRIYRGTTIYGYQGVQIGHNTWIGERVVINCTDQIKIGNNVVISTAASLWTHFTGGDLLAGCRFDKKWPLSIGDDAWIGVGAQISADVGKQALILAGAVVTRQVPPNRIFAGIPAQDFTDRLGGPPFRELTPKEKLSLLEELLARYAPKDLPWEDIRFLTGGRAYRFQPNQGKLVEETSSAELIIFDLDRRIYQKRGHPAEAAVIGALFPRAKFLPRPEGDVGLGD